MNIKETNTIITNAVSLQDTHTPISLLHENPSAYDTTLNAPENFLIGVWLISPIYSGMLADLTSCVVPNKNSLKEGKPRILHYISNLFMIETF